MGWGQEINRLLLPANQFLIQAYASLPLAILFWMSEKFKHRLVRKKHNRYSFCWEVFFKHEWFFSSTFYLLGGASSIHLLAVHLPHHSPFLCFLQLFTVKRASTAEALVKDVIFLTLFHRHHHSDHSSHIHSLRHWTHGNVQIPLFYYFFKD